MGGGSVQCRQDERKSDIRPPPKKKTQKNMRRPHRRPAVNLCVKQVQRGTKKGTGRERERARDRETGSDREIVTERQIDAERACVCVCGRGSNVMTVPQP